MLAGQAQGYPFGLYAYDFVTACANPEVSAPFSTGFYGQFSFNDGAPMTDIECVPVVNSYDPNQKLASPAGFGPHHLIDPNLPIEYHIDFQNTGTDTAYTVVIRDTLSPQLDLLSLRPGASSHPYRVQLEGQRTAARACRGACTSTG